MAKKKAQTKKEPARTRTVADLLFTMNEPANKAAVDLVVTMPDLLSDQMKDLMVFARTMNLSVGIGDAAKWKKSVAETLFLYRLWEGGASDIYATFIWPSYAASSTRWWNSSVLKDTPVQTVEFCGPEDMLNEPSYEKQHSNLLDALISYTGIKFSANAEIAFTQLNKYWEHRLDAEADKLIETRRGVPPHMMWPFGPFR